MSDAAPALTPEQVQAQTAIDAIRADSSHPANNPSHPRHAAAHEELMGYYKRRYNSSEATTTTTIGPEPSAHESPERPELPVDAGLTWDEPALAEVERAAREVNLPHHVGLGIQLVADLARAPRVTLQEAEAALQRQWGNTFDDQLDAADRAWDRLVQASPHAARSLTQAGIRWQPRFVNFLSRVGKRLQER